jgi:dihydroorotate dehydrogenase
LRKENRHKPLFLKISPDLTREQLDDVIDLAREINLDGIVAANTSIGREKLSATNARLDHIGAGGLSGLPLREKSTEIVRYICEKTGGSIPVIASGGIFTAVDAIEKLSAGASMVQVIYEGPAIVRRICKGINQFLQQE